MSKGYTFIETVVAVAVFFVISAVGAGVLTYSASASSRIYFSEMLLENLRITMDFIATHVESADAIALKTEPTTNSLLYLLVQDIDGAKTNEHIFTFNSKLAPEATSYHRVNFETQELASYIKDVRASYDTTKNLLTIEVTTDEIKNSQGRIVTKSIKCMRVLDLTGKRINLVK